MRRRTLLAGGALSLLGVAGIGTVYGFDPLGGDENCEYQYRCDGEIVYEHEDLDLHTKTPSVRRGEAARFDLRNRSEEPIPVGCNLPWALQTESEDRWRHVTWTAGRYYDLCFQAIRGGDRLRIRIPMSTTDLEADRDVADLAVSLEPGRYRLVLVGTEPHLAADFEMRPG